MPITVKLSEHFYRKFGHEVVDEMVNWFNQVDDTYRGELRELNELNFARFDAKLEQRLAEVKAELREGIAALRGEFRAELGTQLGRVEAELGGLRGEFRAALEGEGRSVIKWMFGFWITTVTTLAGLVVAVLHFLPAARP